MIQKIIKILTMLGDLMQMIITIIMVVGEAPKKIKKIKQEMVGVAQKQIKKIPIIMQMIKLGEMIILPQIIIPT